METVVSADDTTIAYERMGRGPPLVLVHGTSADHTRWEPVRSALEAQFTVYAMDRRGRGESGDAAAYDLEREAEDVVAVVESIGEPVTLLGHSFGAICSLEAALRIEELERLVLYEPPIPVGDHYPDNEDALAEMTRLYDDGEDERALELFFREVAGVPSAELDALRAAPNWPARVAAVDTVIREVPTTDGYEFDATRFEGLATPTLLLAGSESPPFFGEAIDALVDALPDARIVVLEGQAHAAMNTAPERFVEAVLAFVRETKPTV